MHHCTNHGRKRIHQRMGIGRKAADRIALSALQRGYPSSLFRGDFRIYLDRLVSRYPNTFVMLFRGHSFIFTEDLWLKTICIVPPRFRDFVERIKKL